MELRDYLTEEEIEQRRIIDPVVQRQFQRQNWEFDKGADPVSWPPLEPPTDEEKHAAIIVLSQAQGYITWQTPANPTWVEAQRILDES